MATQYSVKMRTTCSTCAGDGLVYSALWETCLAEIGDAATFDEILEWFDRNDALLHGSVPPEEETCHECEGRGYTISECSLEDAPPVAALAARLDALEQRLSLGVRPGEWVQGNELLAADAYDVGCTCGVGGEASPEHAAECPKFIPF